MLNTGLIAAAPALVRPPISFTGAVTGSGVSSVAFDGVGEAAGDFSLLVAGNNSIGTITAVSPGTLLRGTPGTNTGVVLAYLASLASGSDTFTITGGTVTRLRATAWRDADKNVLDWKVGFGNGTAVPGQALSGLSGHERAVVYDFLYCETAGVTVTGGANIQNAISAGTSGASWRDAYSNPIGAVSAFTPDALTLSGAGGDWVRVSVAFD